MTQVTISHKTGRNATTKTTGYITHARINGSWKALCGSEPGKRGNWTTYPTILPIRQARVKADKLVSCKRCRSKLIKYGDTPQFECGTVR